MSPSLRMSLFAMLALLLVGGVAHAETTVPWILKQRVGDVWIMTRDLKPLDLAVNDTLPAETIVVTRETGRAVLVRGGEHIILQPNTRLMLLKSGDVATRLEQTRGKATYQVTRRIIPHFRVDTPFVAAVVKGTVFEVDVTENEARVAVQEGMVAVKSRGGRAATLLQPGMVAAVGAARTTVIDLTDSGGQARKVSRDELSGTRGFLGTIDWNSFGVEPAPAGTTAVGAPALRQSVGESVDREHLQLRLQSNESAALDFMGGAAWHLDPKSGDRARKDDGTSADSPGTSGLAQAAPAAPAASTAPTSLAIPGESSLLNSLYVPPWRQRQNVTLEFLFASTMLGRIAIGMMAVLLVYFISRRVQRLRRR